ncbi:phosphatidylinositol glycan anchor biosynthesis class U protein [Strongylocentrotus purpuratus]|uniref:Phosphatidylinositol glycan anchor biosynthesis class U protein n=1 Tax=Strongylocentrotus purpuratus TaxID=7668 RepID=A0A7M7N962_STRPU|nr:phosphatidylinositol glycan anchor biosynthesis class U protein [Strongylocentrotus purpuratus]
MINQVYKMAAPTLFVTLIGVTVRSVLFNSFVSSWLTDRVEISTPLTSWKSMVEGLTLLERGISPYAGDTFHETPLLLYIFYYVRSISPTLVPVMFVMVDLMTAFILHKVATRTMKYLYNLQKWEEKSYASGVDPLLILSSDVISIPDLAMAIYLLCPYSIVTCVAQCTVVFTNLTLAATFLFTLQGNAVAATLCLAFASYQSLYPVTLIVPLAMHIAIIKMQASQDKSVNYQRPEAVHSIMLTGAIFFFWLACLLGLSFLMLDSWGFLRSTYGCILAVPNLQPNMGLFWYFFTEMFEHFRTFFLWIFQINVFIYIAPLAIKMREHPLFIMLVQCILIAIFKSYPSVGDTTLYLALLPIWSHTFHYFRNSLVVGVMMLLASLLAPVLWHLWIYAGSANANFFFAFTLIYNTAQIFLVTDLVFGFLRREFALKHGMEPLDEDGNKRPIRLQ